jgi:hypothetical protein
MEEPGPSRLAKTSFCGSALHSGLLFAGLSAVILGSASAPAATQLTVDLSTSYRPVTHVGNGSIYGVLEKQPADADLQRLVGALHPKMFTNPASSDPGTQQPGIPANAIKVAARLAPLGATVTVRLADWFSGFYSFTNMNDWFAKMGETVSARKAANLTNIYAYEIWNEPNGTYGDHSAAAFNDFWRQSFVKLRQLDPDVKITGPSISWYDEGFLQPFLSYCKTNNCLPDIVGWHEGTGINIESDVQRYRNLEKQLGIGPLPITMNEYSGAGWAKDEGRPGASAPVIAQLERAGVETACITWWTPDSIAGHLGSLLATDTQTNGGWFLYKWYGEMSGNMVSSKSSLAMDSKNLDGFASLDTKGETAYVIFGGISDGAVEVVVKGFKSAPFFGNSVRAVVEHTRWTGRSGAVTSTDTLSTADIAIGNDQISVPIGNVNADDGYRVSLVRPGIGTGGAGGGGPSGSGGVDAGTANLDAIATGGTAGNFGSGGRTGNTGGAGGFDVAPDALASGGAARGGAPSGSDARPLGGSGSGTGGLTATGAASGGATNSSAHGGAAGSGTGNHTGCSCRIGRPAAGTKSPALFLFASGLACIRLRRRSHR